MTVGSMLDDVVADCEFLNAPGGELPGLEEETELSIAYVYREKNGMPKFWMDLSGAMADALVLHCYFRSGEPTFYETVYYLDLESAKFSEGRIDVVKVTDDHGFDVSDWFKTLSVLQPKLKRTPCTSQEEFGAAHARNVKPATVMPSS